MSEDYSEEQLIDLKKEVPRLEEKFREVRGYTEAQNTQDTPRASVPFPLRFGTISSSVI
jgi:hypothetical protein